MPHKEKGAYKRFNAGLIDRLDSMTDDRDYNPYHADKKHTVSDEELFNQELYMTDKEIEEEKERQDRINKFDNDDSGNSIVIVILTIIIIGVLGFLAYKILI